jgi:hypothetical protein
MRTSILAARSSRDRFQSRFESQLAQRMAIDYGASISHNVRKRKLPQRNNHISYREADSEFENGYQGEDPEDTIIVDGPWNKKRKVIVLDDDSDDDIPLAKLTVAKENDGPEEDGPAGKLFRGLPTEVRAAYFFAIRLMLPTHVPFALRATW